MMEECLCLCTHLARLGAGQTAGQWSTVGRQSGGERWAAVGQHGLKVTARLLRLTHTAVNQLVKSPHPPGNKKKINIYIYIYIYIDEYCRFSRKMGSIIKSFVIN